MPDLLPVPDMLIGQRFDAGLSKMMGISRSKAASLIDGRQVKILGKETDKSCRLAANDIIELSLEERKEKREPVSKLLKTVYEDDDIIVVDKPAGVAAHASNGWEGPTVLGTLLARGVKISDCGAVGRQGIVSRLDVGTSGLMLVCKSDLAYREMRRQFSQHEVTKIYHAVTQGNLAQDKATIEAPIGRDRVSDFRFAVIEDGKPSVTHWDILERFGEATLASVNLETGRTHQIRVHFSSISHPLAGDSMYGANPQMSARLGLSRQWLHSTSLSFVHPRTGKIVNVSCEYPEDLSCALNILRGKREIQR